MGGGATGAQRSHPQQLARQWNPGQGPKTFSADQEGDKPHWADLLILTGQIAIESMGGPRAGLLGAGGPTSGTLRTTSTGGGG